MGKSTINGQWPFSIAMLNYQRVVDYLSVEESSGNFAGYEIVSCKWYLGG
jgi:hypothetical protein